MQERELLTFLLGLGVLLYLLLQQRQLAILQGMARPVAAYATLILGWLARLLSDSLAIPMLVLAEHGCYVLTAYILMNWLRGLEERLQ